MSTAGSHKVVKRSVALPGVEYQGGFAAQGAKLDNYLEDYLVVRLTGAVRFRYRGEEHDWVGDNVGLGEPGEFIAVARHHGLAFAGWYIAPGVMRQAAEERCDRALPRFSQRALASSLGRRRLLTAIGLFERAVDPLEQQEGLARLLDTILGRYVEPARVISDVIAHRAVRRMRDMIQDRYQQQLSLDEIAACAGLNKFYALRAFKRAMGVTPHAFQRQIRISKACQMLRNGLRGAEIACAVGFYDQSHLARAFQDMTLLTPRQYQAAG